MEPTSAVAAVLTKIRQMRTELNQMENLLLGVQSREPATPGEKTYAKILAALKRNPPVAPITASNVWHHIYRLGLNPASAHIKRAMIELGYVHHRRSDAIWYLPPVQAHERSEGER